MAAVLQSQQKFDHRMSELEAARPDQSRFASGVSRVPSGDDCPVFAFWTDDYTKPGALRPPMDEMMYFPNRSSASRYTGNTNIYSHQLISFALLGEEKEQKWSKGRKSQLLAYCPR